MPTSISTRSRSVFVAIALSLSISAIRGQENDQTDDVVRVKTELVQTDVTVLDRKGKFVDGLSQDQFELSLDGETQSISFFERVTSGSAREVAQLAAARGQVAVTREKPVVTDAAPATRGRVIFFFLDDVHLSNASLGRARQALARFVDEQMNSDDQIAIVSTSGQIGFLQQLTDYRPMLHEAITRLGYRQNREAYTGKTQISEYMASQIIDSGNRELYAYLLESIKIEQQMGPGNRQGDHRLASSYSAATYLKNRLRQVSTQGRMTTDDTLSALRGLMLSSTALAGRKLLFFLSDGFIINEKKSGAFDMVRKVTDAAARAGVVVYTMDLRGTYFGFGSGVDASTNEYVDSGARKIGVASGELSATREPLQIIADKTGGRAIFNSDSIDDRFTEAIRETSDYCLLAWRPDRDEEIKGKSRVKVTVRGRPDLIVRLRSNFYDPTAGSRTTTAKSDEAAVDKRTGNSSKPLTGEAELLVALGSLYAQKELPLALSIGYVDTPAAEMALKVSMQVDRAGFNFDEHTNSQPSEVDVIGAAVDDRGIISTFKQLLTVRPDYSAQGRQQPVIWNQQLSVPPGLYQVRVAIRDRQTGRTGSAMQWIQIPDTSKGRFDLSSLFLGERKDEPLPESTSNNPTPVKVDVDHKFERSSVLRFQTYIYNATQGKTGPDVIIQATVLRNNRQILSTSPTLVPVTNDLSRLPYWTEIPLSQLTSGRYVLQVSATDRLANSTTSQRVTFSIE